VERHTAPENRLQWSQAIFEVYQMLAIRSHQSVKNIRTIWRYWIINNDTNVIATEAKRSGGRQAEHGRYTEFRVGESAFYASPNGGGIIRMLTEHAQAFGRKTIESVRVMNFTPLVMYFVLSEAEILPATPRVSKSRGKRLRRAAESKRKRLLRNPSRVDHQALSVYKLKRRLVHAVSDQSYIVSSNLCCETGVVSVMDQ
jgi:hypothetical protein